MSLFLSYSFEIETKIGKLENCLNYKVKQSKNGKFTSNYKNGPIDFETQISLRR